MGYTNVFLDLAGVTMKTPIAVIALVFIGLLFVGAQYRTMLAAPFVSEAVMDADGCLQ